MRKILGAGVAVLVALVYLAPTAWGEPIDSGEGRGAGWSVTVPGVTTVSLVPEAVATVPQPCPAAPAPCEDHETNELVGATVEGASATIAGVTVTTTASSASLLRSAADAYKDAGAIATLQSVMDGAATPALPTSWNTRGYARAEGFSALDGTILADTIESETATAMQTTDGMTRKVVASGVRVVNLRLAGALAAYSLEPIVPDQPNQTLLDAAGVKIVYWQTNWDSKTATTTDGGPVGVTALRITDAATGTDVSVAQAQTAATYTPPPPAPNPPNATDDSASTAHDTVVTVNVATNDSDPDGDLVASTVTVTQQPPNGTVTCTNGTCTYTPDAGFSGTDTFEYQVCDSGGRCDTATVTITVAAPAGGGGTTGGGGGGGTPAPPNAADDSATTNGGTAVTVDVDANDSDPDGDIDPTTISVAQQAANGTVTCSNGSCTYTPNAGFSGTDTFEYRICDSGGRCDTARVTIIVPAPTGGGGTGGGGAPANQPPTAVDDATPTEKDTPVTVNVVANDSDPERGLVAGSVTVTGQPANGSVICNDGICTYTPAAGFTGTDTFTYTVCDTSNACDTAIVTITVSGDAPGGNSDGSNPPEARDDSASTSAEAPVTILVAPNDDDPDGDVDPATVSVVDHPDDGAVVCSDGSCTYTPDPGFSGTDTFDYTICDSQDACDSATVTIIVDDAPGEDADSPPVAEDDAVTTPPATPTTIPVTSNDGDPDGDLEPSTVSVIDPPQFGSATCDNGSCTYTPEPGFHGNDAFTYQVCDSKGSCTRATVNVLVPASLNADIEGGGRASSGGGRRTNGDDGSGGRSDQPKPPPGREPEDGPATPNRFERPGLGSPPQLPLTGADLLFFLRVSLNLLGMGLLLLMVDRFVKSIPSIGAGVSPATSARRARLPRPTEAAPPQDINVRETSSGELAEPTFGAGETARKSETIAVARRAREPRTSTNAPAKPIATASRKVASNKTTVVRKATSAKKTTARKSTVARKATVAAKTTTPKKSSGARKTTVGRKSAALRRTTAGKAAAGR